MFLNLHTRSNLLNNFLNNPESVRSLIAISIITGCVINFTLYQQIPEVLGTLAVFVLGYYFKTTEQEVIAQRSKNNGHE